MRQYLKQFMHYLLLTIQLVTVGFCLAKFPIASAQNLLQGKRVLWIGTSIPAHCTYPKHSANALGFSLNNRSVGASFITIRPFTGTVHDHTGYSLSLTRAEKDSIYRPWVNEGIIDEHQLDVWKYTSYESLILSHLDTTDIVIIDHGFNDGDIPILDEYLRGPDSIDWQNTDRTTYIGAFNYLYQHIKQAKPGVIIALGGYFQHMALTAYKRSEAVTEVNRWIANHYDLPLLDVWNYTDIPDGYVPNSTGYLPALNAQYGTDFLPQWIDSLGNITYFQQFCPDGVHPWSNPTGHSDHVLDSIFIQMLPERLEPYLTSPHVMINEVMTNNVEALLYNHRFPESWFELYNPTTRTVSLKGWRIGTSPDFTAAYTIEYDKYVPRNGHAIICCDGRDDHWEHTNFALSHSAPGSLFLWDADGQLVDSVSFPATPCPDLTYGRILDGTPHWELKVTATPGETNLSGSSTHVLPEPRITVHESYAEISVDALQAGYGARVFYTLDGSLPNGSSPSFSPDHTQTIVFDTSTVIRARTLSPVALPSPVATRSVVRHPRPTDLPIISLTSDDTYLYSSDNGILLGNDWDGNCFRHWPRPIFFEYFEHAGSPTPLVSQQLQADTYGVGSLLYSQKSLKLTATSRYGSSHIPTTSFWPSKPNVIKSRSFILRNGGGRALDTRFEDAFAQQLFGTRIDSLGYEAYRPVIVYINGRYNGIYELREAVDASWAESNCGVDLNDVSLVESLTTADAAFSPIQELLDNDAASYEDFARVIDIPRFIDYLTVEAFATNTDFPHTNVTLWRDASDPSSRFRPLLRNLDYLSTTPASTNWFYYLTLYGDDALAVRNREAHRLFIRLLELPAFRYAFIDRMMVYLGDFCKSSVTVPIVQAMRDEISAEVEHTFALMSEHPDYERDFLGQIKNRLIPYCETRPLLLYGNLNTSFRLGGVYHLIVQGADSINGIKLVEGDFQGCCFASRPVRISSDTISQWQLDIRHADGTLQHYRLSSPYTTFLPSDYGTEIDSFIVRPLRIPPAVQLDDYQTRIRAKGYDPALTHDWSQSSVIDLPQPRLAYINLQSRYGIPYTKTSNFQDSIEYYDGQGNYFMKRALVNVQGASSTAFPKRNIKLELIDGEWDRGQSPTVDFENWVKQDRFHLKAFYADWLRGVGIVGYQLYDQMEQQMPAKSNRIWKRAGIEGHKNARCYPDGFPCMMYLNGQFYGIYVWQLSKHRRNMAQQADNVQHIHLDGNMGDDNFWNGRISWSSLDARNPNGLIDIEGNPYDGGVELIDETSPLYGLATDNPDTRAAKQRSAQVKQAIIQLSQRVGELQALKQTGASDDEIRAAIARHFDVESMLNYLVFSTVVSNYDGFTKNWQWLTYDGGEHWHVAPYDLDCTFGNYLEGTLLFPARYSFYDSDHRFTISRRGIATWFWDYYFDELCTRYAELRDRDIFSAQNISSLFHDWYDRIGSDVYDMEWTRWPDSRCISQTITNTGWALVDDWTDHFSSIPSWNAATTYHPGDLCRHSLRLWVATSTTTGVFPYLQLGYTDSLERLNAWISERLDLEDDFFRYIPGQDIPDITISLDNVRAEAVYGPDGIIRPRLLPGLNIVRYSDGSSHKILIP